jgi:hypothetical protein
MKVLRCGGAVDEAKVDISSGVEKTLRTGARVLRALALVAVRQQKYERRRERPLGSARGDELVEHHLRAVDEVAVLRLPNHESAGFLHVVAELKADDRVFAQRTVVDFERSARLGKFLQRYQLPAGLSIVKDGMSMTEGAAFDVLARHPNRIPSARMVASASSSDVAQSIVRASASAKGGATTFEATFKLAVEGEALRTHEQARRSVREDDLRAPR